MGLFQHHQRQHQEFEKPTQFSFPWSYPATTKHNEENRYKKNTKIDFVNFISVKNELNVKWFMLTYIRVKVS